MFKHVNIYLFEMREHEIPQYVADKIELQSVMQMFKS